MTSTKKIILTILASFSPMAFLGLIILPNKYEAWGGAGVDCDGSSVILYCAIPALIAYFFGFVAFARAAYCKKSVPDMLIGIVCLCICAGLAANIYTTASTQMRADYQEACEEYAN